eukprot:3540687-Rhodomonas_salina.1
MRRPLKGIFFSPGSRKTRVSATCRAATAPDDAIPVGAGSSDEDRVTSGSSRSRVSGTSKRCVSP